MRITTVDRYLGQRFIASLTKAILAFVFLFVLIDLLTHRRDDILKHDVPLGAVLRYYAAYVPWIICQVSPLAVLVSALLVLGDAAQNNEVTAMLAGGVSLRRLARAPIFLALVFAVGLFAMEESVGTYAAGVSQQIENKYFSRNLDSARAGVTWANLRGGFTCHILKFNRLALTGENVLIHAIESDTIHHIDARRIYWDETKEQWILEDGHHLTFDSKRGVKLSQGRITQGPAPFDEAPGALFALDKPPETLNAPELASIIRYAKEHGMPVTLHAVRYHSKFSQPAICFVMVLLAVPFAMRLRRGGLAISFGASIAIAMVFLVVFATTMKLGDAGRIAPMAAAWMANVVFLVTGVALFLRTPT